ncbi:hypothetical protein DPQ33_17570 [Oceanidesulfovibrio indonesiensis]|uniref:Methyltransferase type 11 domain-containing protein n=2 Tax=Oceanidesulfovibrio indonesiensis TaxID=54767 RepID=A0A7M3MA55_9BACT|nr:hypothetical protein DPQ33_17570 [Oceanidesulfovibrio indonesiensis]
MRIEGTDAMDYAEYSEYLQTRKKIVFHYRMRLLYPRIARHLQGKVVDIGCGIGDFLRYYKNSVGVDVNPHTVRYCQEMGLEAVHIENATLPFADGAFGGAVMDNVLEHLGDPMPTLREAHRVLAQGGRIVVGVPGRRGYAADPDHEIFYDEARLEETLDQAGFACTTMFHMPFKSGFLDTRLKQYCIYGVFAKP